MTRLRLRPHSPLRRAAFLAWAALQLVLGGVVSLADARAEAEGVSRGATAHVEEHGTPSCPRVHGPDCALCSFLTTFGRAERSFTLAELPTSWWRPLVLESASAPAAEQSEPPPARAPPALV